MEQQETMSEDHKYTVAEIDRMRAIIYGKPKLEIQWFASCLAEQQQMDRDLAERQARYAASVEDRLRTYMLGGVRPEELERAIEQIESAAKVAQG